MTKVLDEFGFVRDRAELLSIKDQISRYRTIIPATDSKRPTHRKLCGRKPILLSLWRRRRQRLRIRVRKRLRFGRWLWLRSWFWFRSRLRVRNRLRRLRRHEWPVVEVAIEGY